MIKQSDHEHLLVAVMHHIISDGWSIGVMMKEVAQLYQTSGRGEPVRLEELRVQYADWGAWEARRAQTEPVKRQLDYWERQLGGEEEVVEVAGDRARPALQGYRGKVEGRGLDEQVAEAIRRGAARQGVTRFMLYLAAFMVQLNRYSNQEVIRVGTPVANRREVEAEGMIGLLINMVVMRGEVNRGWSVGEQVRRVREVALEAYGNEEAGFERVVERVRPARSLSHSPLFQVMLVVEQEEEGGGEWLEGLEWEEEGVEVGSAKYDLTLMVKEKRGGGIELRMEYNEELYEVRRVRRMLEHYERVVREVAEGGEKKVGEVEMMGEEERRQVLVEWNETGEEWRREATVVELIEEAAQRHRDRVAVVAGGKQVSYGEVNRRANQLARYLIERGVGPETRVGIMLERDERMVVCMLGVMKAGGAYVPLDATYPAERLRYMIDDAQAAVVLTSSRHEHLLEGQPSESICLDRHWGQIGRHSGEDVGPQSGPLNLSHVIYTSGSTGGPKGVAIKHRA